MKKHARVCLSITLTLVIVLVRAAMASAQAVPVIAFGEDGVSGGSLGPLPSSFGPDPLSTGAPAATLFYTLPFNVVTGDVQLTEPPTGISDLVRFENLPGGPGAIFFYSDNLDGGENPADVGLPPLLTSTPTVIAETGTENNNSAIYTPAVGAPGFPVNTVAGVQYNIISDTPEPSTFVLATVGLLTSLSVRSRSRRK
jgi:hypothetical protein